MSEASGTDAADTTLTPHGIDRLLGSPAAIWALFALVSAIVIALASQVEWLVSYPEGWTLPVDEWIRITTDWLVVAFKPILHTVSRVLDLPLRWIRIGLEWLPWTVTTLMFVLVALRGAGRRVAIFTAAAFFYIALVGYWAESMSTLSLVAVSIPLSAGSGFALGIWSHRSDRVNRIIQPTLDFMQTVPAFAYLTPILLLFGFGPVVGLIASMIFAAPPMVRNTILGLSRVPGDVIDAARMSGCTPRQCFWQAEVPSARNQLLIGLNQTTMAALSMVIIAAIIGGFEDIGWEILSTMRKAQFGQSLLAGFVIALLAMVLERISAGFATRRAGDDWIDRLSGKQFLMLLGTVSIIGILAATVVPFLWTWPDDWRFYPAGPLNDAVDWILIEYGTAMTSLKNTVLFYFMLPLKIGFVKAVAPFTFGFTLTTGMKLGYLATSLAVAAFAYWWTSWRASLVVGIVATILYYGTTGIPWPVWIGFTTLLALRVGGKDAAIFVTGALGFVLLSGSWIPAMLSVYLCGAAVLICVVTGMGVGVWASTSDTISAIVRPINDTLQTMPQFVLLIPALMLFRVGEFTALLAVIAYAIVPAIRYTEAGLRNVSPKVIEAATAMGSSPGQIFWRVKLPQAAPEILLGINQTILFGFAMLAIAALVGTTGLGQQMYLGLSKADAGMALVAGISMALLAMAADRILQAAARHEN